MLDLDAYLRRIGYAGPREPTLQTLRALQVHHPRSIPFENLDTLAGRPVRLDRESLERKLVHAKRGGYCFEHNTLFGHVLAALGLETAALSARVVWDRPELRARTHMVLLATLPEGRFICDVGFGGLTPTAPLELTPNLEQPTPHETFRIVRADSEFAVEARVRGDWRRLYRFDLQQQLAVDIDMSNYYVMGHPESPMLGRLIAARTEPDRRYALLNGSLSVHHLNGTTEQRNLATVAELRQALRDTFAIDPPHGADIDAALAGVLG